MFTVKVLQGLWRNDLVALKGACPNCGEEVCIKKILSYVKYENVWKLPLYFSSKILWKCIQLYPTNKNDQFLKFLLSLILVSSCRYLPL
jgi:hypothetical protein